MAQSPNQFTQTPEKGQIDLKFGGLVITAQVVSTQSTPLVPGQCVVLSDVASESILVGAAANDTANVFGVVLFNPKDVSYAANSLVEIATFGSVVYMEASAAIARNAEVMLVATGSKVALSTTGKNVIGTCLDKSVADGNLVRVLLGKVQKLTA